MKSRIASLTTTVIASTLLAGCGAGIEEIWKPDTIVKTSAVQGGYTGKLSSDRDITMLVLEDDQFYSVYGNLTNGSFAPKGFMHANGKASNGSFTASDLKDFATDGTAYLGSLSASYAVGANLNGSVTEGSSTTTFTSAVIKSSLYNYGNAASTANINGNWTLTDLQGVAVDLKIGLDGAMTASSGGCTFSGTVTPRASGKNVFDLALTFGAAPCRFANQILKGIAVDYLAASGKRQLLLAATDSARNNGIAYGGLR
jgi:hypothetical protein